MQDRRPEKQKIILDWVTISYREIFGTIVVILLGIIAAVALYFVYFRQPDPKDTASTEIRAAERALGRAKLVVPPEREDLASGLTQASDQLSAARELFRRGLYDQSIAAARTSQKWSDEVYSEIGVRVQAVATLQNIGGNVDVQRANSARWVTGSNGMQLFPGDKIRALSASGALVRYVGGNQTSVGEDTVVTVLEISTDTTTGESSAPLLLLRGEVTAESTEDRGATIRTPEAEAKLPSGGGQLKGGRDPQAEKTEIAVAGEGVEATVKDSTGREITLNEQEGAVLEKQGVTDRFEWIRHPKLILPPDGKVFVLDDPQKESIELQWEAVPNADRYRLEISRLHIFTGNLNWAGDRKGTSARIPAPPLGGWWWRVYTVSPDGRSSLPSPAQRFQVRSREAVAGEKPSLEWTDPPLKMGTKVLIEGTTDSNALLTYSVNDSQEVTMDVEASGRFSDFIELTRPGRNIILLRAQSPTGAESIVEIPVDYESY